MLLADTVADVPEYLDPATQATKHASRWYSHRLGQDVDVVRWGHFGIPLLLYPTAGGDAEEVERFFLVKVLEPFIHDGRLKVYSVDSVNGRTWLTSQNVSHCVWVHKQYDEFIRHELVPLIRTDCRSESIEIMTAGASIGALNALISLCRHPDVFSRAICMSGTYDVQKWLGGQWFEDFYYHSPLMFVPNLPDGSQLSCLRRRMVVLPTGQGRNEDPGESWKVAHALGSKGIPNRVDMWDESWIHDWTTWREMLPRYVEEALAQSGTAATR
jgi:esterase/lipase superfamily enzyme